jgi:hypothetical protein
MGVDFKRRKRKKESTKRKGGKTKDKGEIKVMRVQ